MKRIIFIMVAIVSLQATAQDQKREHRKGKDGNKALFAELTPEETADLQTKKMTLNLELTETQQSEVKALLLEEAIQRKQKMEERKKKMADNTSEKPSKEERLKMVNDRLDHQIVMKEKMKNILNDTQFEKWEASSSKRKSHKRHKRGEGRKQKNID